ncbi:hypothetical protein G6O45_26175, partial [Salmonella enterica subsp. enterica serovar Istanbul]|nr:hypothetical protein [Salmonella enterica subsp. enterica serovar Istanbul]
IKISGFGNFGLRDKRQRPGRNPQTGDPIRISERRVLTFKASQILKQALNAKEKNGGGAPHPSSNSNGANETRGLGSTGSGGVSASGGGGVGGAMSVPLAAAASEAPK